MLSSQPNAGKDLIRIHKVVTRALSVSLQQSKQIILAENLRKGFLSYLRGLTILLHAHHEGEDEISFPFWKTRHPDGSYDLLIKQHIQMITYLDQIEDWITKSIDNWQDAKLIMLYNVLTDLQNHWHTHINQEEEIMSPVNAEKYLSPAENVTLIKQLAEHGQAHSKPPEIVMPFIVYNLDEADRIEFIRLLPPEITQKLIPIVWKTAWEPMIPFLLL